MSDKVAEIKAFMTQDDTSAWVGNLWNDYEFQRREWIEEKKELRDHLIVTGKQNE